MTTDVDLVLRAHADAAATAVLAPDDWDRLVARLEDPVVAAGGADAPAPGSSRTRTVLAAAAVVVVIGAVVAAAAVLATRGGDEDVVAARPDPSLLAEGPPIAAPGAVAAEVPGPQPDRIVAVVDVTGDGAPDLVRFDGLGERVELADGAVALEDLDQTVLVDGAEVALSPGALDVGPDGVAVYLAAVDGTRVVRAVEIATGDDLGVIARPTDPSSPAWSAVAVSPDGTLLAVGGGDEVHLVDRGTRAVARLGGPAADGLLIGGLAWSPDGTRLARVAASRRHPRGTGGVLRVATVAGAVPSEVGWGSPFAAGEGAAVVDVAFLADGRLAVVTPPTGESPGTDGAGLGVIDLGGGYQWRIGGIPLGGLDATADGRWLIVASTGGGRTALRAFSGDDLQDSGTVGQLEADVVDVSW